MPPEQRVEMDARQRHGAWLRRAVRRVAMKIGAAVTRICERRASSRYRARSQSSCSVMVRLDARRARPRRNAESIRRAAASPGCASEAMPPAVVNLANTSSGERREPRHVCRAAARRATSRTPGRSLATCPAATMARATARPPGRLDGSSIAGCTIASASSGMPSAFKRATMCTDALDPSAALFLEKCAQRRRIDVDEIAEDVHVARRARTAVISMPATNSMPAACAAPRRPRRSRQPCRDR